MKIKTTLTAIVAGLTFLILFTILFPQLMISPGKTIAVHANLAEDCFACHSPFVGADPEKCVTCHNIEEIGVKTTNGQPVLDNDKKKIAFHQQLVKIDCGSCHSDHEGVKAFRPQNQFSHDFLDPRLQEQCRSCHTSPTDSLHQKTGENCIQCHNQQSWTPATFDHEKLFRFDRNHKTECVTCHNDGNYAGYTCYGCHEHSPSKIRKEHVEEGIYQFENCVDCHRSGEENGTETRYRNRKKSDSHNKRYEADHDDEDEHD